MVDPTYTLKAVRGMVSEMQKNPARFKGKRVLFLHTGNCCISSLLLSISLSLSLVCVCHPCPWALLQRGNKDHNFRRSLPEVKEIFSWWGEGVKRVNVTLSALSNFKSKKEA